MVSSHDTSTTSSAAARPSPENPAVAHCDGLPGYAKQMITMNARANTAIRAPEVAGRFYPDGRAACVALLESRLAGGRPCGGVAPKGVVESGRAASRGRVCKEGLTVGGGGSSKK